MTNTIYQVIHTIKITEECGFTAARWTDKGNHLALRDIEGHGLEGLFLSVPKTKVLDTNKICPASGIGGGTSLNAGVTHGVIELERGTLETGTESIANGDGPKIQAYD